MEIWKDCLGFEGLYQASDLGNIKSLKCGKERILKPGKYTAGYFQVVLSKNKEKRNCKVHRLVYEAFNGKTDLPIDHINNNKTDNRLINLQAITQRENTIKRSLSCKKSSKYTGVYWFKPSSKWMAYIRINGKQKNIGLFINEIDASNAYQKALTSLQPSYNN